MTPIAPDQYKRFMRPVLDGLRHNPGSEIVRHAMRRADLLSLGAGEGDWPTPDFIVESVKEALDNGKTFYGPILGLPTLRQEIADYYARIFGVPLDSQRVVVTMSGTQAVHLALTSILDEGDEAVAVTPLWKNLLGAIQMQQARLREVELDYQDGRWSLDLQKLVDSLTDKTRAIVLNSPSNPTGWVMSLEEMRAIMDVARARGIWVVSDEVYGRLVYGENRAPSFLDVAQPEDRLFVVNSFSKNWAMTGWRLGWLIGPPEAEQRLYNITLYDNMGPPNFSQYGGIAALRHGEPFIEQFKAHCQKNRDFLYARLAESSKADGLPPESTFYAFFRVCGEEDCMALARRLIDEQALGLAPGCAFGQKSKGFLRLCFAVSEDRLADATDRLLRLL